MDRGCATGLEKQSRRVIVHRVLKFEEKKTTYDCFIMYDNNKYKNTPQI